MPLSFARTRTSVCLLWEANMTPIPTAIEAATQFLASERRSKQPYKIRCPNEARIGRYTAGPP